MFFILIASMAVVGKVAVINYFSEFRSPNVF